MSTRQPQNQKARRGFRKPTTTPTPDEIFDVWLSELKPSELKVLLYIVRRTFGFKKDADTISLNQICSGITTKDGRVLDRGTGLSRKSASQAVQSLEERGLIKVGRAVAEDGVNQINTYSLLFEDEEASESEESESENSGGVVEKGNHGGEKSSQGVVEKSNYPSSKSILGVVEKSNPQQTVIQETEQQQEKERENNISGGKTFPKQDVVVVLSELGIVGKIARRLARRYSRERVFEKIDYLVYLQETDPRKVKNPRGWLRTAIEENYGPPDGYKPKEQREAEAAEKAKLERELGEFIAAQDTHRSPDGSWQAWLVEEHSVPENLQELTEQLLDQLKLQMPASTFHTWVARTLITELGEEQARIATPSQQAYDWLTHQLKPKFEQTLAGLVDRSVGIEFEVIQRPPRIELEE